MYNRVAKLVRFPICILLLSRRSVTLTAPHNRDEAWIQDLTDLKDRFPRYNQSFDADSVLTASSRPSEATRRFGDRRRLLGVRRDSN